MTPLHPITRRNLLYFVMPVASNDVWRQNVEQLKPRLAQFNGKRVVAVATGDGLASPDEVMRHMGREDFDFIVKPNDPVLRERAPFLEQLERVRSVDLAEATFYAHAKGVTRQDDPRKAEGVMYWRNLMYRALLDDPAQIGELLRRYPVVGTHRKVGRQRMPGHVPFMVDWHFAGTFFWFRNDAFFSRKWQSLPASGWGVEGTPGLLFRLHESYCVVKDKMIQPYDPAAYKPEERIVDQPLPAETPAGLLVELGGGTLPKPGYTNVDLVDNADVKFDLETLAEPGVRLPFDDDSVGSLYTSHCLEHLKALVPVFREIIRVCRVGARVEIRVPHWYSSMAMCPGHVQVFGPAQVDHWTKSALDYWYGTSPKKLSLVSSKYVKTPHFDRWKRLLPKATDQDVLELCPDAAHESQWVFSVVPR